MDGANFPRLAAIGHVLVFALIVLSSFGAMAYITGVARLSTQSAEVSKPIPELVRWAEP